jgi:hypothetical protein
VRSSDASNDTQPIPASPVIGASVTHEDPYWLAPVGRPSAVLPWSSRYLSRAETSEVRWEELPKPRERP